MHTCLRINSSAGDADYTIRMNYTVVPRTWEAVNKHHHGASRTYKVSPVLYHMQAPACPR